MDYGRNDILQELNRQSVPFEGSMPNVVGGDSRNRAFGNGALSAGAGGDSLKNENEISLEDDLNVVNFVSSQESIMPGARETDALGRAGVEALSNTEKVVSSMNTEDVAPFKGGRPAAFMAPVQMVQEESAVAFSKGEEISKNDVKIAEDIIEAIEKNPEAGYNKAIEARGEYLKSSFGRVLGGAA